MAGRPVSGCSDRPFAFIVPGQMAETVGMGRALLEGFPAAVEMLERTEAVWGAPLRQVLLEGPEDRLHDDAVSQPLLTWYACALGEALKERGRAPAAVAGYSVGVFAGLAVAGSLALEDALAILKFNRERIEAAGHRGGMLAVGGMALEAGEEYADDHDDLSIGVVNGPHSWTLTGTAEAIARAEMDLRPRAFRMFRLPSVWSIHSPLLEFVSRAAWEKRDLWRHLRPPQMPFISPFTGEGVDTADQAENVLGGILSRPMRWDRVVESLLDLGHPLMESSEGGFIHKLLKLHPARPPALPALRLLGLGAA